MYTFQWDPSPSLARLVSTTGELTPPGFISSCEEMLTKKVWTSSDRQRFLTTVSTYLVHPQCTASIAKAFRPLLLDILERSSLRITTGGSFSFEEHERICVACGTLLRQHPDVFRFLMKYLQSSPPVFERILVRTELPVVKPTKKKKRKHKEVVLTAPSLVDVLQTCYKYLKFSTDFFMNLWDFSPIVRLITQQDLNTTWYAVHIVAILSNMADKETQQLLSNHFSEEDLRALTIRHQTILQQEIMDRNASLLTNPGSLTFDLSGQDRPTNGNSFLSNDISSSTVPICGVLLPVKKELQSMEPCHTLVQVPSTASNLHSLALAVSSGTAVLLEGAVGCGKSALVDYLAQVTGRGKTPQLLKVQLGDQTDSKALIGTYRCTDIPGEFIWQPGALTRAVTGGQWILLEDIDYAPMDVVSVLVPLLESSTLSLPGHGDVVRASPGFQLFATQRLSASSGGYFRQHTSHASLLDKVWTKVNVEPLSQEELRQVIVRLHSNLVSIVDKLLDIFCMMSSGDHSLEESSLSNQHSSTITPSEMIRHQGRLISTRDLLKWCSRVAAVFDVPSPKNANRIFLEALDCFSAALPNQTTRTNVANAIGVRLGLSLEKCSFFTKGYKPSVDMERDRVIVGRTRLARKVDCKPMSNRVPQSSFAFTRPASILVERVAVCINNNEPVLLVGETGTGKTSAIQYLADLTGHVLKVINMNQQSDSTDLLGGFKPVDFRHLIAPLRDDFESLFVQTFSRKQNVQFLMHLQECFSTQRWHDLIMLIHHCYVAASKRFDDSHDTDSSSGKDSPALRSQWRSIGERIQLLKAQLHHSENALAFSFVEGTLVQAVRAGDWVLLDEINLATAETLECLSGLLESTRGTVTLLERGDLEPIVRHKDFRLFACMNPATDVGKKELPPGIRNRFTEFYVDELEDTQDLKVLVGSYLRSQSLPPAKLEGIVQFYLAIRKEAEIKLADGTGHRPHYSLRTLCRALRYASSNPCGSIMRSLYESFCLSFLTQLDRTSHPLVERLIAKKLIGQANLKATLRHPIPPPAEGMYLKVEGYWIATGNKEPTKQKGYVLTPSVRANLHDLARIVSAGSFPVLLQGETSVGKTSLIQYLALATGNHCVRVNNHEHTDLQEYVGFYAANETGKLVFKEGVLVDAMRKGHWVILDELNLAPSDVLEALNRLLDDNRELYIPETQEMVPAHKRFMLFATQNPPGQYGGRKVLSRAFRNRFVELHFDEIPSKELQTILHDRCAVPLSYCKKMVAVMLDLQTRRKGSGVFSGKQGFITLRDLFRWAERYRRASQGQGVLYDWDQHIADDGYLLLAGRIRRPEEQSLIKEVLEKHIRCRVDPSHLFSLSEETSPITRNILEMVLGVAAPPGFGHVVWTLGMRRLAVLVGQAIRFQEPVLLVGETGCGKTTICQLHAALAGQTLYSVNCHLHTETSDFLGGLRPVRQHSSEQTEANTKLFEWCDGPLVLAMKEDSAFLIDEISLADDSVLERLNSVLEPGRTLLLAERGSGESTGDDIEEIVAGERFFVVATMNPGGDFGKKELSPALRNRFTEIWCPQSNDASDLVSIIEHNLIDGVWLCNQEDGTSGLGNAMVAFIKWFQASPAGNRCTMSIRDLLSWVNFINTCCTTSTNPGPHRDNPCLDVALAYVHGACMVFLDGLGSGATSSGPITPSQARQTSLNFLHDQILELVGQDIDLTSLTVTSEGRHSGDLRKKIELTEAHFGIEPFYIARGTESSTLNHDSYALDAPTTALNAQRVLRALQLSRAILLEGSPGVGKTSLVSAIAKASGHSLVRINLSEQTDVSDLFGADLPLEGGEGGQFVWRDGPLLRGLKEGSWIVLDELNLASQSVLEGLNACLDHRAEVYVPELGRTFHIQQGSTRLFACQNPLKQGGGRKGLPRSFLNRFTQVYVEPLTSSDLLFITHMMYPMIDKALLNKMVEFNKRLYHVTMVDCLWGQRGSPWEFNLRDLFRWCHLMVSDQYDGVWQPAQHVGLIYRERMRSQFDKCQVQDFFKSVFGDDFGEVCESSRQVHVTPVSVQIGHSFLRRSDNLHSQQQTPKIPLQLLHCSIAPLEALMKCVQMNWMAILVGPSASGKTSLVHLLANLTGHRLRVLAMNSSMDTTELLGGFEQADVNRHWERALQSLRSVATATVRLLLLANKEGASQHVSQLLASLAALNVAFKAGSQTGKVVSQRLLDMFDQVLNQVCSLVEKHRLKTDGEVIEVTKAIVKLRHRLESTPQGGGGGKFEWVDGMLVQALLEGDWVLIDNVNFCSPSVLDRLNALLEPNGVLSINERGVIDGCVPTIKPHPEFRLVLAMDPRHGEISRAMRNRGVEIYMLGENEGGGYSRLDLLSLLNGIGLSGYQATDLLLDLHKDLKVNLVGSDVGSLPSILLVARVTVQLLERGRDLKSALSQACQDVLVRGQLSKVNRQKVQDIISSHLGPDSQLVPNQHSDDVESPVPNAPVVIPADDWSTEGVVDPSFLATVDELRSNAVWAMMKRKSAVLMSLLGHVRNHSDTKTMSNLNMLPLIKHATLLLMEQSTPADWQLQNDLLMVSWRQWLPGDRTDSLMGQDGAEFVRHMPDVAMEVMQEIFRHPLRTRLSELLEDVQKYPDFEMLKYYSLNFDTTHHHIAHLDTIRHKMVSEKTMNDGSGSPVAREIFDEAADIARRLYLFLLNMTTRHVEMSRLTQAVDSNNKPTTSLQLSYAFHQGMLAIEDLPHPLVAHLYPFFNSLDAFVSSAISNGSTHISDDAVHNILLAVDWRDRCWQQCDQPIGGRNAFHLGQFALHWGWVVKKMILVISGLLGHDLPQKLQAIIHRITDQLSAATHLTTLKHKGALQCYAGKPMPYRTCQSANTMQHVHRLCQSLDVLGLVARLDVSNLGRRKRQMLERCVRFVVRDGGLTRRRLIGLLTDADGLNVEVQECMSDDLVDSIQCLEAALTTRGLYQHEDNQHIPMEPDADSNQPERATENDLANRVGMWPSCDHISLCAEQSLVNGLLAQKLHRSNVSHCSALQSLVDFTVGHTPTSPLHLLPYTSLQQSGLSHTPSVSEVMGAFMRHLWQSTATCHVPLWLSWQQNSYNMNKEIISSENTLGTVDHGPAILHTPLQSHCAFSLLCAPPQRPPSCSKANIEVKNVTEVKLTTNVPLCQYLEKVEQLKRFSEILWCNATVISTSRLCFRTNSTKYLMLTLSQLLESLGSLLPSSDHQAWQNALQGVTTSSVELDGANFASSVPALYDIIERRSSQPGNEELREEKMTWNHVGPGVKATLECIHSLLRTNGSDDLDRSQSGVDGPAIGVTGETISPGEGGHLVDLFTLGKGWVHYALLSVQLLAPMGPVDPAEKKALKLQYAKSEALDITNKLKVHNLSYELLTGLKLENIPACQLPNRLKLAQQRLEVLKQRCPELAKQTAFRPEPPQFDALLQDVAHYLTSIGSRSTVEGLLDKLLAAMQPLPRGAHPYSIPSILNQEKAWQTSQSQFVTKLQEDYPLYRDQWTGLVVAAMQLQYGMRLMAHTVHGVITRRELGCKTGAVSTEDKLCSLAAFPALYSDDLLVSDNILELVRSVSAYSPVEVDGIKMRFLRQSLLRCRYRAFLAGHLTSETLQTTLGLFSAIVASWKMAEDAAKLKEEEEASLYKFKPKTHGDGLTDEQREEKEFRQSFPSFQKDFADINTEPTLEQRQDPDEDTMPDGGENGPDGALPLTTKQMHQVCTIHQKLYTQLVRTSWIRNHSPSDDGGLSSNELVEEGYGMVVQLSSSMLPCLDPSLDSSLLGAHILMSRTLHSALSQQAHPQHHIYDIYQDSNVAETVQCRPLLETFRGRVCELLDSWPDHPTLKQLILLVDRILEFTVTSPLMKFVTGLELLLEKAQEWEGNANRAVSVREHLEDITDLIIQWRKLELRCWSACLDTVAHRQEQSASKWWFHIYHLVQSNVAADHQGDVPTTGSPDENSSILSALQQFMEGSSLGEFTTRLKMLLSFHCQLAVQQGGSPRQVELASLLWNLHCYYKQFLLAVENEIRNRRTPIEKELKGYVKIARWNDINFWAMKQAVEKSHKTLHKFSKKFETELKAPARSVFIDTKIADKEEMDESLGVRPIVCIDFATPVNYKAYMGDIPPSATPLPASKSLQVRLPTLVPRMTKLCQDIFMKCSYPALTNAIDELTGEIITGVKELQQLDVTKDADKDKQKSEVRRIQQRKRKSLADLFRYLTTIGLSYRKGLMLATAANQHQALMLPPVDLAVALITEAETLCFSNQDTINEWEKCHRYFVKCTSRTAAMRMALAVPSKELGVGNIDRFKGFAEQLNQLVTTQRQTIATLTEGFLRTRNLLAQLQEVKATASDCSYDASLPPQHSTLGWIMTLKELIDVCRHTAHQYCTLLDCCPDGDSANGRDWPTPLPREHLAAMDTLRKGDALLEHTIGRLQECQQSLGIVNDKVTTRVKALCPGQGLQFLFWSDIKLLNDSFDQLESVLLVFVDTEQLFTLPQGGEKSCLSVSLVSSRERLLKTTLEFSQWKRWLVCGSDQSQTDSEEMDTGSGESSSNNVADIFNQTESILAGILLAVQTMVKTHGPAPDQLIEGEETDDKDTTTDQENQELELQDGHLVKHLSTALTEDSMTLDLGRLSGVMESLLVDVQRMRDASHSYSEIQDCNASVKLTLRMVPVLHQYVGLVAFVLNQSVSCHRTTCKLQSVLLGVFTELASKGFCLPAGYSDEMGGEGATEFKDIEGGGIGEGEGVKDVSDQIDNEDQVQDTQQGDKKEEEEDYSNQPDIKDEEHGIEMSEDFQGKLHDGEAKDDGSSESDENEENEMDKQMGDVDQPDADKLDERMWGDQEDEEEEGEGQDKKKEEFGDGEGEDSRTDLVAKDDNKGAAEDEGDNEKQGKENEEETTENNDSQKPKDLEPRDEGEFNDDDVDPSKANDPPAAPTPDDLDLPDDLNLDEGKMNDEDNDNEQPGDETNPFDIETKLPDEKAQEPEDTDSPSDEPPPDDGGPQGEEEESQQEEPIQEDQDITDGGGLDKEQDEDEDGGKEDGMEEDGDQQGGVGIEPMDDNVDEPIPEEQTADYQPDQAHHQQEMPEPAENYGKSKEKTEMVQEQPAQEDAGKSEEEKNKEKENVGSAESSLQEGHRGTVPTKTLPHNDQTEQQQQNYKRQPGHSDAERSLGSTDEKTHKRLRTMDSTSDSQDKDNEEKPSNDHSQDVQTADLYEHLKDATSNYDTQLMDAASEEQQVEEQARPNQSEEEEEVVPMETGEDVKPLDDEKTDIDEDFQPLGIHGSKFKPTNIQDNDGDTHEPNPDVTGDGKEDDESGSGSKDPFNTGNATVSTIHTNYDPSHDATPQHPMTEEEIESLRREMEQQLSMLSQKQGTAEEEREAQEAWHRYGSLTSSLARDLCEQLRLVLEPTRASKLRGDFRTGKRINMRKVIPYIASGFRKDKIWLRRTKPSKRQYQILLAVDDSSSMADNRSRQLAFESLAVISNALTWLEAGELGVCSFGESVQLLQPFHEQFTDQSGARILRHFTFTQTKTKIAQLLDYSVATMLSARSHLQSTSSSLETSQLLLVVSDGRGLFLEGMERVKAAVRRARQANVFLVFVALDNPENKDSILDIKVPIFGGAGELPQISTYMEHFPFPFYIILKDINSMPEILSDALRQWFELVTAGDIQ